MRLSRYLRVCCPEEAKFEQAIDVLNYYHDIEDRLEVLIAALRPNQIIRKMRTIVFENNSHGTLSNTLDKNILCLNIITNQ